MAISQRLRFEVLRRDNYTCRYCGASAPDVEITVDHVIPKALGGTDEPSNLCAACRRCNGGKTSSSPDAPLVADVAEDALQWARAMQAATARMLADLDAREADRDQFQQWWDNWAYGEGENRHTLPLEAGWQQTVDQLVSAGLPLRLLKECIDRAMSRQKVTNDQKFRYMCGIAWKKLTELQETARRLGTAPADAAEDELSPEVMAGRADLACELLGDCLEDVDRLHAEAEENWQAETDEEKDIAAIQIAWMEQRIGYSWLAFTVCDLLILLPDELIRQAVREARIALYDEHGPSFSRADFAERATTIAVRKHEWHTANNYLSAMSGDERAEWERYARSAFRADGLNGQTGVLLPAACARDIKANGLPYLGMCLGRGRHILRCAERATHYIHVAEFPCCQDPPDEHTPHLFCDYHFSLATSGQLTKDGNAITVTAHGPVDSEPIEAVPF